MAPASSVRAEVHIKAPAEEVWAKLIDTSTWPEWNSFVPVAEIMDESDDSPEGPKIFKLGTRRRFIANINKMKQPLIQKVTVFEIPNETSEGPRIYRISWAIQGYPHFLFNTLRFNEIEEVITDDGPECIYRTGEDQSGPLAYPINMAFGKYVENGIKDWANDLKNIMEAGRTTNTT